MKKTPQESEEDRIRAHYKSLKRDRSPSRLRLEASRYPRGNIYMDLARCWKRPIAEIKRIVLDKPE